MTAFHFGASERPLFGYYHAPGGPGSGAVVICPPGAGEHQYAHRALRVLAQRLAERGRHVLRFDYSGTGDSWGEGTDADPAAWIADAGEAVQELRAMSGARRVDLVGLRFGGTVAARTAAGRPDVGRVVLWDPVLDGEAWLAELDPVPFGAGPGAAVELGAQLVSERFVDAVRRVVPWDVPSRIGERVLLLLTRPGAAEPLAHVEALEVERLEQPAPWVVDESIWTGQVPAQALARICDWLD